ncbi:MAG: efflux RND transporter permease subunit, partial [Firmicutes bacterium]|nr:efflux RND transporter permease subunit [Bacillota bacterium]
MNSLIKTTIKRPVTVCVLVVILLAVGVLATMNMSTNLLPNIKMPMLGVTVIYPGAAASSVEEDVTQPLENILKTIPGITELETRSYDNVSVSILTFDYGTDIDVKISAIEDAFDNVTLPSACQKPSFVKIDMNGTAAATLTVYKQKLNLTEDDLSDLAKDADALATKLRAIEGVGSVSVLGKPEKQIEITALQGLDITALAIVQALSLESLNLPLGTILQDGSVVSIRNASDATSVLQVMQLPVKMDLGTSAVSSVAALQVAVKTYAYCTKEEFNDYVDKALSARDVIDEIEGKSSTELEDQYDNLASIKSLMSLVRENNSQRLRLLWNTIENELVQNEEFVNMSDEDLLALSESGNYNLSYDVLVWLRDGAKDGSLKADWFKLVDFRAAVPNADENGDGELNGDDITYDQFAMLFQDGGQVIDYIENGETVYKQFPVRDELGEYVTDDGEIAYSDRFAGLDILHSDERHADCDASCDKETFSHEDAVKVCEFADSVNTVAYRNIIDAVKEAEENLNNGIESESPIISDELFAALFINSAQGNDFQALMSPQVIHIIRLENFNADVNGKESVVRVLTEEKEKRVDADGNAVYVNGETVTRNDDGEIVVLIGNKEFKINGFGRVVDSDNKIVDAEGKTVALTDEQIASNYYSYGSYIVFTDEQLLSLYDRLNLDDTDLGITPTLDTVRFVRVVDASEDASALIVPVAYVGKVSDLTTYQAYAEYNGYLSVTLEVYAVSDANTTDVVNAVKEVIGEADIDSLIVLLDDKAEFINDSIMNVLTSIIIGGVLAVLIIYLFVGKIGSSLVVSITMPLSVLVALLGLWAMGISLNMVSLGGLAVGIGMLVDNSIVVLESITKRR